MIGAATDEQVDLWFRQQASNHCLKRARECRHLADAYRIIAFSAPFGWWAWFHAWRLDRRARRWEDKARRHRQA